jgi:hypothetical protein
MASEFKTFWNENKNRIEYIKNVYHNGDEKKKETADFIHSVVDGVVTLVDSFGDSFEDPCNSCHYHIYNNGKFMIKHFCTKHNESCKKAYKYDCRGGDKKSIMCGSCDHNVDSICQLKNIETQHARNDEEFCGSEGKAYVIKESKQKKQYKDVSSTGSVVVKNFLEELLTDEFFDQSKPLGRNTYDARRKRSSRS